MIVAKNLEMHNNNYIETSGTYCALAVVGLPDRRNDFYICCVND